jgi:glycerate kinase
MKTNSSPRVLVAPNAFKGTLTAREAAEAIARGLTAGAPGVSVDLCPVADGGDGTLDALLKAGGFEERTAWVAGPLGPRTPARWGWRARDATALLEMAEASGLRLMAEESRRDPLKTSTFGTGQLLLEAEWLGAKRVWIGVGGSATVDGGSGALSALGWRFESSSGRALRVPEELDKLGKVIPPQRDRPWAAVEVLCDVDNPLLGPRGAAAVFGPQKGARPDDVPRLEERLAALARAFGGDPSASGSGASGGLAYGLAAALGAKLVPGAQRILETLNFWERLARADWVITGEGKLDAQSARGKAPVVVAQMARASGKPCAALCGIVEPGAGELFALAMGTAQQPAESPAKALERAAREIAPQLR